MSWKTFTALLARDAHVSRRNLVPLLLQTLVQPLLFVFIFGRVMTGSGLMPVAYKSMLLPGIIAISMMLSGVQAVAMPVIAEFQFTREIEDRLLAPIRIEWLAVEKILAGMIQALFSGFIVLPAAWLLMGSGLRVGLPAPATFFLIAVLVALFASAGGLLLGCSMGQTHIGLMYSLVIGPMLMFGCAYYPWRALDKFPLLQKAVLINPLVYASEGLRASLAPQIPHLPVSWVLGVLAAANAVLLWAGIRQFVNKSVG